MKVVFVALSQLRKKLSCKCNVKMALDCTQEEVSFVSLDDWDDISISLVLLILLIYFDKLEEENTHLFNKVSSFIFKFEKTTTLSIRL